jgi:hypothetical protein
MALQKSLFLIVAKTDKPNTMKLQFLTIKIEDKYFDLPKDMQIPQKGSTIFIEGEIAIVEKINYHISEGNLHSINIIANK